MAEVVCPGVIFSESEFLPNEIHFGKCGENMQAMLQSWARQKYRSTNDVYVAMRQAGRCALDGVSNMGQHYAQAKADGFKAEYMGTNTRMAYATWAAWALARLPRAGIGVEVANGAALRDELTGKGEDASNLRYHLFSVYGHHSGGHSPRAGRDLPAGWWCADGDNYVNNTTFSNGGHNRHLGGHTLVFYSEQTMRNARPCAALAMYAKATVVATPAPPAQQPQPLGASTVLQLADVTNYFVDGGNGTWKAKANSHTIQGVILSDYRARNGVTEYGLPITQELAPFPNDGNQQKAVVRVQAFERGVRVYDPHRAFDAPPRAVGAVYAGHFNASIVLQALGIGAGVAESPADVALLQAARAAATTLGDLAAKAQAK